MKIEHIAIWSKDIEILKEFYMKYFKAKVNAGYHNSKTGFKSYFLSFSEGPRVEIMNIEGILNKEQITQKYIGYCHLAMSVGSKSEVLRLTQILLDDGYEVVGKPRYTGDGYFESVILDPDGNRIEITV